MFSCFSGNKNLQRVWSMRPDWIMTKLLNSLKVESLVRQIATNSQYWLKTANSFGESYLNQKKNYIEFVLLFFCSKVCVRCIWCEYSYAFDPAKSVRLLTILLCKLEILLMGLICCPTTYLEYIWMGVRCTFCRKILLFVQDYKNFANELLFKCVLVVKSFRLC